MKLWKNSDCSGMEKICYIIDYEDHHSYLAIHYYEGGVMSCGYLDRSVGETRPGYYVHETSFLDILVVAGITKTMLEEVKQRRMDAMKAAEFLTVGRVATT